MIPYHTPFRTLSLTPNQAGSKYLAHIKVSLKSIPENLCYGRFYTEIIKALKFLVMQGKLWNIKTAQPPIT